MVKYYVMFFIWMLIIYYLVGIDCMIIMRSTMGMQMHMHSSIRVTFSL